MPAVKVKAPIVSVKSFNCNVPPLIITAPVSANTVPVVLPDWSNIKVPALVFVSPE